MKFVAGQTVPNLVVAKGGAGGKVSIFNFTGATDVVVDVMGWFPIGASFSSLTPARLLDTRGPGDAPVNPLPAGGSLDLGVLGVGGVPDQGVGAVVLNVTATNTTRSGYLTVWPAGEPRPTASNLNFVAGQTVPNLVVAKVGAGGKVSIFNFTGATDVVVDVMGWFPLQPTDGAAFHPQTPARVLDTRGPGDESIKPVAAGGTVTLAVAGAGGVPADATAVVVNVTATNTTRSGYLTVWPAGEPRPTASNLNFVAGQTVPNLVVAKVGAGGKVSIFNFTGATDVVVDIMGWFG